MRLWKKKEKQDIAIINPFIEFQLIDDVHLEIVVGWPPEEEVGAFANFLSLLNSGNLIGPQINEVVVYANSIGKPEHAMMIQAALEKSNNKKNKSDKPIIVPSKFMAYHMRNQ